MICYYQNKKAILICFLLVVATILLTFTVYHKAILISQKIQLFKQTLRDIILLFQDIAGLDMNLEEWKQLFRKAWENDYDYLQIDRFAKIGNGRYTIRNCIKNNYIECTPQTKPF